MSKSLLDIELVSFESEGQTKQDSLLDIDLVPFGGKDISTIDPDLDIKLIPFGTEEPKLGIQKPMIEEPIIKREPFSKLTEDFYSRILNTQSSEDRKKLGVDDTGRPIEDEGFISKTGKSFSDTFRQLRVLKGRPDIVFQGLADFTLSIPGFAVGIIDAGVSTSKELVDQIVLGNEINLEEVYNSAAEGMQRSMEFFEPGKEMILGKVPEESRLIGEVAMAPMTALSMTGHKIADWEGFKDYPNIRGAARFAGDIAGIGAMGFIMHGPSGKGKLGRDIEEVVTAAEQVAVKESRLAEIPNEIAKQAMAKVLEIEKIQLELKAKDIADSISKDAVIREELLVQSERLAREKMLPVTGKPEATFVSKKGNVYNKVDGIWYDEAGKKVTNTFKLKAIEKGVKEKVVEPVEPKEVVEPDRLKIERPEAKITKLPVKRKLKAGDRVIVYGEGIPERIMDFADEYGFWDKQNVYPEKIKEYVRKSYGKEGLREYNKILLDFEDPVAALSRFFKDKDIIEPKKQLEVVPEPDRLKIERPKPTELVEPITEIDQSTGSRLPNIEGEKSPFFQDSTKTTQMAETFTERATAVSESVEMFTQKIINDVNQWYHKLNEIDIESAREGLSELASRADELRGEFITGADHAVWKETISEAATWARRLDRKVIKTISEKEYIDKFKTVWDEYEIEIEATNRGIKPAFYYATKDQKIIDYAKSKGLKVIEDITPSGDFIAIKDNILGNIVANKLIELSKRRKEIFKTRDIEIIDKWNEEFSEALGYDKELSQNIRDISGMGPRDLEAKRIHSYIQKLDRLEIKRTGEVVKELTRQEKIDKLMKTFESEGFKLTTGIDPVKGIKALIEGAKETIDYVKESRELKKFKPKAAIKNTYEELVRSGLDVSGNIRTEFLDKLGDEGYRIIQAMYLSKGAHPRVTGLINQMSKEVYSGLNRNERRILDTLVLTSRMVAIAKTPSGVGFKYPKKLTPEKSVVYSELFGEIEKISPERTAVIRQRAKAYFDWMKKPLKEMHEAELITAKELNDLSSHNYSKLKLVDLYDVERPGIGPRGRTVYDSGIQSLKKGRDTDIFESSSKIMALEVFNRAYGRIMNNKANLALLDVAKADPTNPFVRVKLDKADIIPSGWKRSFVFKDGERIPIYISPKMAKEWLSTNKEISYKAAQIARWVSGSVVLRTFATGINWGFALANLPMDVMRAWFAARTWKDGKWESVYSPITPVYGLQMSRDLATVFSDSVLRKGRFNKYLEEGGGLEYLTQQGRLFQKGRHLEGPLDKIQNVLGYFGETSENMTRLAIMERVIRNRAKERGLTMEQARKVKGITREAAFAARDQLDFGQGGSITKALDTGIPYLSAAIQGTRGMFRTFIPGSGTAFESTFKLAQFAALTTGTMVVALNMAPETMEELEGNPAKLNNLTVPIGDQFGFEDEYGQMRYPFFKIPLDHGQRFFKTFFEAAARKQMGYEIDINEVVDSLKSVSPVGVSSLPPTISGTLGYVTNKDFWLNEDIWRKTDRPFAWPESREEYIPGRTPQVYIDIGQVTGLSPERTRYAVEELVTSGTVWSYLLGQGYDAMFSDLPKSNKEQHIAQVLSKMPITKRFIGITNPYSKYAEKIEKAQEVAVIERFVENRGLDALAEGYLFKDTVSRKEVIDYMRSFKDLDTFDRLKERFLFQEITKDLPERSFWLRLQGVRLEARARVFVDRLEKANPEQRKQIWKEYSTVVLAKGIVSKGFREEVLKLRGR